MKFEKELSNSIKSRTKIIQIISYETLRIHGAVISVANELKRDLYVWNRIEGIRKWDNENKEFIEEDEEKKASNKTIAFSVSLSVKNSNA